MNETTGEYVDGVREESEVDDLLETEISDGSIGEGNMEGDSAVGQSSER